jgi:hypothetical protein
MIEYITNFKQEVLGRTNRLLSFILHEPHWKRRVQQFFYGCVCIRYCGNVSTEPLPSNDRGGFLPSRRLATIRKFLPIRCLATKGGFLPSRCLATITGCLPSRYLATIRGCLPSRYLATIRGIHRHTRTDGNVISYAYSIFFFKIKRVR